MSIFDATHRPRTTLGFFSTQNFIAARDAATLKASAAAAPASSGTSLPGGDIEIPGLGKVPVLALAGVAAVVGYVVWMKRK